MMMSASPEQRLRSTCNSGTLFAICSTSKVFPVAGPIFQWINRIKSLKNYLIDRNRSQADSRCRREGRQINRQEVHLMRRLPKMVRMGAKKKG